MSFAKRLSAALRTFGLLHSDIEKITRQIKSATDEYKSHNANQFSAPFNTQLHIPEAIVKEKTASAARQEIRDTTRLLVEKVGLGLGVILAGITIGQYVLTRRAVEIAAVSASAAQRGAAASESQAEATKQSIISTVDAFRLDQRAWVGPADIKLNEMKAPNSISAVITIANTGKTPALNCGVNYLIHASDVPLNIDQYMKHPAESPAKNHPNFNLFPNGKIFLIPATGTTDELGIQNVKNGKKLLYVFGQIQYSDVFGRAHKTRFCGQYDPRTDAVGTCDSYSYID